MADNRESASILLVDDDEKCLDVVKETLTREGHRITATIHSMEAVELFAQVSFHLSILDVHMPEMNGFEVFQQLLDIQVVPCIFITADDSKELRLKAMDLGVVSVLYKPINPRLLKYTVEKIIGL